MTRRPTVAVALHDGFYGCGTGAGYANYGFLEALTRLLPTEVRLAVLPVWLTPLGNEHHSAWYARTCELLSRVDATVHPLDNGTAGLDRWGELDNFEHLVRDTARKLLDEVLPHAGPILVIAFDAPFLGLPHLLPSAVRESLVLVPRSSALIHAPHDTDRVDWERAGLQAGTPIAAISAFMKNHLLRDYAVPPESLRWLRDGLSDADWSTNTGTFLSRQREFVLTMGRAEPYKGFDDVLDAFALHKESGRKPPHLVLAATAETPEPTPYQRSLASKVRELGIDATVLTRFTPDVAGLLRHPGLRGVIVPSRAEPFGRIPMEAFASGAAPVITTTAGGLAEQVLDGTTGFTCPPGEPRMLADALARALATSGEELAALRRRARHRVLRDYNYPAAIRCFLAGTAPWLPLPSDDDRLRWLGSATPQVSRRSSVSTVPPVKVPIGPQARHWNTVRPERLVLVVAHHVTSLIRLLDVLPVFDADPRIQVVFSWNGSDPFRHGLDELLNEMGAIVIPWSQAIDTEFDLAIAANHGGLTEINAPVVVISHGIGYAKNSPENRKSKIENRKSGAGGRSVFGFSPEWLLYNGHTVAASLVLPHSREVRRLAKITPEAVDAAVVAGDPCYDRMLRSRHLRERYREALGVHSGQKLVAVATSWYHRSLLGSWPSVYRELLACLPADEYRVAALVHPNIWHGHGPWQVHTWLADCARAGLIIVPPVDAWQATLIAADVVVGDHGATTCYGAALPRPVLLAAFPEDDVAADSAIDLLGRAAPRLNRHEPLRAQLDDAMENHSPDAYSEVRDSVSSCPGESAARLRTLFYEHMELAEPSGEPPVPVLPVASVSALPRPQAHANHVVCALDTSPATMTRYPADVLVDRACADYLDSAHLVVHEDHPKPSLLDEAAIVLVEPATQQDTRAALTSALRRHPGATLAATTSGPDSVLRTREGTEMAVHCENPAAGASFVYTWLRAGRALDTLPPVSTVRIGPEEISVRVEPAP